MNEMEQKFLKQHYTADIIVYNKETKQVHSAVYNYRKTGGLRQYPIQILFSDFVKELLAQE